VISEYRLLRSVHFYETDAAGIVHFSNFNRYMEEAEHALWRAAGMGIADKAADNIGWPRVAASFLFHQPLRFEDEFEVWIRIKAISEKSMTYECFLMRGEARVATGSMTIACVERRDDGSIRSRPIPADIRALFEIAEPLEPISG
jgi:YbgC/YbaW family acyl-CoA thioester hydrolase